MAQKRSNGTTPKASTNPDTATGLPAAPVSAPKLDGWKLPENLRELLELLVDEGATDLLTVQGCMSVISDAPNVAECDNRVWVLAGFDPKRFGLAVTDGTLAVHEVKRYAMGGGDGEAQG